MKYKICVTRILEHFEIIEVESENETDARVKALKIAKDEKTLWTEAEKPIYKTEIIKE